MKTLVCFISHIINANLINRFLIIKNAVEDKYDILYVSPNTHIEDDNLNQYIVNLDIKESFEPVLVAGGTGIASIHFLANSLSKPGSLYYGVRKKEELMCLTDFEKMGWKINISTEDGSYGYKGFRLRRSRT